jgi:hypothetical protein
MGFQTVLVAFLADLLAANRKMLEDVRYKLNRAADDAPPLAQRAPAHRAPLEEPVIHG